MGEREPAVGGGEERRGLITMNAGSSIRQRRENIDNQELRERIEKRTR